MASTVPDKDKNLRYPPGAPKSKGHPVHRGQWHPSGHVGVAAEQPHKRKKTALERREQRRRSEARLVQRLLKGFASIHTHRGGTVSVLGKALARALGASPEAHNTQSGGVSSAAPRQAPAESAAPEHPQDLFKEDEPGHPDVAARTAAPRKRKCDEQEGDPEDADEEGRLRHWQGYWSDSSKEHLLSDQRTGASKVEGVHTEHPAEL